MPTYHYRCSKCGYEFEEFQPITEDPINTCPKCQATPHRVITGGGGLIFKGSGFYETDYKRKGEKKDSSSGTGESKPSGEKKSE